MRLNLNLSHELKRLSRKLKQDIARLCYVINFKAINVVNSARHHAIISASTNLKYANATQILSNAKKNRYINELSL
jgi:anti-anti-sigma regulatory factor